MSALTHHPHSRRLGLGLGSDQTRGLHRSTSPQASLTNSSGTYTSTTLETDIGIGLGVGVGARLGFESGGYSPSGGTIGSGLSIPRSSRKGVGKSIREGVVGGVREEEEKEGEDLIRFEVDSSNDVDLTTSSRGGNEFTEEQQQEERREVLTTTKLSGSLSPILPAKTNLDNIYTSPRLKNIHQNHIHAARKSLLDTSTLTTSFFTDTQPEHEHIDTLSSPSKADGESNSSASSIPSHAQDRNRNRSSHSPPPPSSAETEPHAQSQSQSIVTPRRRQQSNLSMSGSGGNRRLNRSSPPPLIDFGSSASDAERGQTDLRNGQGRGGGDHETKRGDRPRASTRTRTTWVNDEEMGHSSASPSPSGFVDGAPSVSGVSGASSHMMDPPQTPGNNRLKGLLARMQQPVHATPSSTSTSTPTTNSHANPSTTPSTTPSTSYLFQSAQQFAGSNTSTYPIGVNRRSRLPLLTSSNTPSTHPLSNSSSRGDVSHLSSQHANTVDTPRAAGTAPPAIQHSRLAPRRVSRTSTSTTPWSSPGSASTSHSNPTTKSTTKSRLTWFGTSATASSPSINLPNVADGEGVDDDDEREPEPIPGRGVWRDGRSKHGFPPLSPSSRARIIQADRREEELELEEDDFAVQGQARAQDQDGQRGYQQTVDEFSHAEATRAISFEEGDSHGNGNRSRRYNTTEDPPTPAPRLKPYMKVNMKTPRRRRRSEATSEIADYSIDRTGEFNDEEPDSQENRQEEKYQQSNVTPGRSYNSGNSGSRSFGASSTPNGRSILFAQNQTPAHHSSLRNEQSEFENQDLLDDGEAGEEEDLESPPSPPPRVQASFRSSNRSEDRSASKESEQHLTQGNPNEHSRSSLQHRQLENSSLNNSTHGMSPASPSSQRLQRYLQSSTVQPSIDESPVNFSRAPPLSNRHDQSDRLGSFVEMDRSHSMANGSPPSSSVGYSRSKANIEQSTEMSVNQSRSQTTANGRPRPSESTLRNSNSNRDRSSRRWFESSPPVSKTPRPAMRMVPSTPLSRFSSGGPRHTETPLPQSMDSFVRGLDDSREDESEIGEIQSMASLDEETNSDIGEITNYDSPSVRPGSRANRSGSIELPRPQQKLEMHPKSFTSQVTEQEDTKRPGPESSLDLTSMTANTVNDITTPRLRHPSVYSTPPTDNRQSAVHQNRYSPIRTPRTPVASVASKDQSVVTIGVPTPKAPGAWLSTPSSLRKVRFSPSKTDESDIDKESTESNQTPITTRVLDDSLTNNHSFDTTNLSEAERFAEAKVEEVKRQFFEELEKVSAMNRPTKRSWLFGRVGMVTQCLLGWSIFRLTVALQTSSVDSTNPFLYHGAAQWLQQPGNAHPLLELLRPLLQPAEIHRFITLAFSNDDIFLAGTNGLRVPC